MLEWLKTILGDAYNEDVDKQVSAEIGKGFVARADFNALNENKKTLEEAVKERDKQMDELKKVDPAELEAEIKKLQEENKEAQTAHEKQVSQLKLDGMLDARLIKEGAVNTKAVRALLDAGKISLDGDNLVGVDDQLAALKESDKWAFGATQGTPGKSGARQGAPAGAEGGDTLASEITGAMYGAKD